MNQDFSLEEALKVRWLLLEFHAHPATDEARFVLVGASETIYSSNVGAVGQFMAAQDSSFVTLVQRVLNYTDARLHYGHPDFFSAEWVRYGGTGLSKAAPEKNLSEDLFFGTDARLRGQLSTHVEFVRYGKGQRTQDLTRTQATQGNV
jgi:1,3-beta-glucan synthase